jgi:Rps23 Pro-64 3,4-dihydroxylase Tpa1-like proline 4-hydroxylase
MTVTNVSEAVDVGAGLTAVLDHLRPRMREIHERWSAATPFRYVVVDDFLPLEMAEEIYASYPVPDIEGWDKITYAHQKLKFSMQSGFPPSVERFFQITASPQFIDAMSEISGIPALIPDPDLVGGGLHQILRGGFLDVHVDYNFHPKTKLHRRLNLLVYMNKDWKPEYEGHLELWDWSGERRQLEKIAPHFNRAVMFETNEISYHGHPIPLATPPGTTRKSLALYYYTAERDSVAPEHNTIYQQSTGVSGYVKTAVASAQAAAERSKSQGLRALLRELAMKTYRKLRGLPPPNR